jgi:hypothetical protein
MISRYYPMKHRTCTVPAPYLCRICTDAPPFFLQFTCIVTLLYCLCTFFAVLPELSGAMPLTTSPIHLRIIGTLLIVTVITVNLLFHNLTNIIWWCNISALLAGIALLCNMQQAALVGAAFMIIGLAGWFLNVVINHMFENTLSYITHFSYACIAVYIFFRIPVDRYFWLRGFAWYLFCQLLSRLFTSPAENINLAFNIWPGWDQFFDNYLSFWLFITLSCAVFLLVLNRMLLKLATTTHKRSAVQVNDTTKLHK